MVPPNWSAKLHVGIELIKLKEFSILDIEIFQVQKAMINWTVSSHTTGINTAVQTSQFIG